MKNKWFDYVALFDKIGNVWFFFILNLSSEKISHIFHVALIIFLICLTDQPVLALVYVWGLTFLQNIIRIVSLHFDFFVYLFTW